MAHLGLVTVVVPDYDEAIAFYVDALGFELVEDTRLGGGKRWVVVAPPGVGDAPPAFGDGPGAREAGLLLARAVTPEQSARIGDQTGGRVGWFLNTGDFDGDYARMRAAGVLFEEAPRDEPYGRVAVFRDPYGNRWDLIQPNRAAGVAGSGVRGGSRGSLVGGGRGGRGVSGGRGGRGESGERARTAARTGASGTSPWPVATPVTTARLRLEPLRPEHAAEAFPVLADERLHTWTGERALSGGEFEARYRRLSAGRSPDGTQGWLNWMLRRVQDGRLVGTVQATLRRPETDDDAAAQDTGGCDGDLTAEVAWVVGHDHQGNGYAREGALAMARWLREHGADTLVAHIHPGHAASAAVARALGLSPTDTIVDGEIRWSGASR